jgi:hypothetical protein
VAEQRRHIGWCRPCRKQLFTSRKAAKRACRRRHPAEQLTAYRCPVDDGWHGGHLPRKVREGRVARSQYYEQRPRSRRKDATTVDDRSWQPKDAIDQILYEVWCSAMDAAYSKDFRKRTHECSVCHEPHSILDEDKYLEYQSTVLNYRRQALDAHIAQQSRPVAVQSAKESSPELRHDVE